jgi:hypothetical protein
VSIPLASRGETPCLAGGSLIGAPRIERATHVKREPFPRCGREAGRTLIRTSLAHGLAHKQFQVAACSVSVEAVYADGDESCELT